MAKSDSAARASRQRIVPAIPLNFSKPSSVKVVATPESSEPSGSDGRQEHGAVPGLAPKSIPTTPHRTPLTPESKSSTPANGDHVSDGSVASTNGIRSGDVGISKDLDPILPATPISNAGSHAPSLNRRDSHIKELQEQPDLSARNDSPVSNGVPAFSPQRGTYRLPPPFYPSEKSRDPTPRSHTSQTEQKESKDVANGHHPRPSAMRLVFGGMPDSSSSSPVPFSPSGTTHYSPSLPPLSTFTGNVNATPFYPAVAMPPFFEPRTNVAYTPLTATAPSFTPFTPTHQPWMPPGAPFHYAVAGSAFPIQFGPPISPSLSQRSSAKHERGLPNSQQASSEGVTWQQPEQLEASSRPATGNESFHDSAWADGELPQTAVSDSTVEGHVLSQFGKFDYADCLLEMYLGPASPVRFPGHRLMLARSPRLAAELATGSAMAEFNPHGLRMMRLWAPSRFATASAIIEALRYLYGAPLQSVKSVLDTDVGSLTVKEASNIFTQALSFVSAGSILELPDFGQQAFDDATSLLSWRTVDQALAFGIEALDTQDLTAGTPFSTDSSQAKEDGVVNGDVDTYPISYERQLLTKTLNFLAKNFPQDFSFDATAPQLTQSPRLPPRLLSSRPSVSDPRLSHIQFGDINGEAPTEDQPVDGVLSGILVSLPFPTLKALLEHSEITQRLTSENVRELAQATVEERERRRLKAGKASKSSKFARLAEESELWENLEWEESVEDGKLARSKKHDDNATETTKST